jgi:hypothetical protein
MFTFIGGGGGSGLRLRFVGSELGLEGRRPKRVALAIPLPKPLE